MIQNMGIKYRSRRVPKKNAIPTIFPQKSNNPDDIKKFDEAVSLRENVESVQHDCDVVLSRQDKLVIIFFSVTLFCYYN